MEGSGDPETRSTRQARPDATGSAERMRTAAASMSALSRWPVASLTQEAGQGHCSPNAKAKKARRNPRDVGLTHLTASNLRPTSPSRERKCLRLHTVPGLHFPESPRESASDFTHSCTTFPKMQLAGQHFPSLLLMFGLSSLPL